QSTELSVVHHPTGDDMEPYERLLGDAMMGDAILFAREDAIEAAWTVVDPILKTETPVIEYEPGTWGPREADRLAADMGGWHDPRAQAGGAGSIPAGSAAFLAGDIGGTSTRLGLFEVADGALRPLVVEHYSSRQYPGLAEIVRIFRTAHPAPIADACFGVAGPVIGGHVETPNLP